MKVGKETVKSLAIFNHTGKEDFHVVPRFRPKCRARCPHRAASRLATRTRAVQTFLSGYVECARQSAAATALLLTGAVRQHQSDVPRKLSGIPGPAAYHVFSLSSMGGEGRGRGGRCHFTHGIRFGNTLTRCSLSSPFSPLPPLKSSFPVIVGPTLTSDTGIPSLPLK